ncbi:biotin-independent malonate decarboxylase subunit gamma [Hydrogenophaga sp. PAMC20947]|uniref:biotin-independent malonate decarboxylase subunit gamma n=1 Tax=Hydrogenophaga sp. PAMC20947 TaxID=2565558 RepID=UPI00109DAE72|nr:biotin-independent malonate decarboxylase subunit gamma [Hydrogenophaga sp. PAMC20947]QCB46869.1 biotin-independent malonate decarboxylase subunit gamma [Hydrogenophaga sp. PAMC20947]
MIWQTLVSTLFGDQHTVTAQGNFLQGEAQLDGATLTVVGTTDHAPIGVELALAQAQVILDTLQHHPQRTLLLLIDTQGQMLRRRDELLGINRAMAHLGCCIDLARRTGHCVIGLVYDQALSGGFITSGLIADACYALPEAEIRVMRIPAMARITKINAERLTALSLDNPVFAPGVDNYVAMGGIRALWPDDLKNRLREAIEHSPCDDVRAQDGERRGGRRCSADIVRRVLHAA